MEIPPITVTNLPPRNNIPRPIPPIKPIPPAPPQKNRIPDDDEDKDIFDLISDLAGLASKDVERANNGNTLLDVVDKSQEYKKAKKELEKAKKGNDKLKIAEAEEKVASEESELFKALVNALVGALAGAELAAAKVMKTLDTIFERKPGYIKEKIRNINEELETTKSVERRIQLINEKRRLYKKLENK